VSDWGWLYAHQEATGNPAKPDHNRNNNCPYCEAETTIVAPAAPVMGASDH